VFTSNIQKGGALLDDARRLVEVWNPTEDEIAAIRSQHYQPGSGLRHGFRTKAQVGGTELDEED
jgi:hypothetical protein